MSKDSLHLKYNSIIYIDYNLNEIVQKLEILKTIFIKTIYTDNYKEALAICRKETPDLVIITIQTTHIDSIMFIKNLRQYDYHTPIMVLSEFTENNILLEITNLSIDAYLEKPLNMEVFTKSIYKSIKRNLDIEKLIVLDEHLVFNLTTHELSLHDSIITLGVKELKLLLLLIKNRSRTVTKDEIRAELWPIDSVSDSAIKKLVFRIRKKMASNIIVSIKGLGYGINIKTTNAQKQLFTSA